MLILIAKLTKRARLSTEEVLYAIDSPDEEQFEVDDPDEPFMYGSDDDFSDLGEDDDSDDDLDDNMDLSPHRILFQEALHQVLPKIAPHQALLQTYYLCGLGAYSQSPSNHFNLMLVPQFPFQNCHWKSFNYFLPQP